MRRLFPDFWCELWVSGSAEIVAKLGQRFGTTGWNSSRRNVKGWRLVQFSVGWAGRDLITPLLDAAARVRRLRERPDVGRRGLDQRAAILRLPGAERLWRAKIFVSRFGPSRSRQAHKRRRPVNHAVFALM